VRLIQAGIVWAMLALIWLYQHSLSAFFGRSCRFLPTCSHYAADAIRKHGPWAGLWLAVARYWRCRPAGDHGFDPVPDTLPQDAYWWRPWRYGVWSRLQDAD